MLGRVVGAARCLGVVRGFQTAVMVGKQSVRATGDDPGIKRGRIRPGLPSPSWRGRPEWDGEVGAVALGNGGPEVVADYDAECHLRGQRRSEGERTGTRKVPVLHYFAHGSRLVPAEERFAAAE